LKAFVNEMTFKQLKYKLIIILNIEQFITKDVNQWNEGVINSFKAYITRSSLRLQRFRASHICRDNAIASQETPFGVCQQFECSSRQTL
jgi:hypothetical protein